MHSWHLLRTHAHTHTHPWTLPKSARYSIYHSPYTAYCIWSVSKSQSPIFISVVPINGTWQKRPRELDHRLRHNLPCKIYLQNSRAVCPQVFFGYKFYLSGARGGLVFLARSCPLDQTIDLSVLNRGAYYSEYVSVLTLLCTPRICLFLKHLVSCRPSRRRS